MLKPQDILILLKIVSLKGQKWTFSKLSYELFMSPSQVYASINRSTEARLYDPIKKMPFKSAFEELLIYGIKYIFYPKRGGLIRGIPTGYAAPPLNKILQLSDEPPPVWPDPEGKVRGYEISPLYKTVPKAIKTDLDLYESLALIDAIRDGRPRERMLAAEELRKRILILD